MSAVRKRSTGAPNETEVRRLAETWFAALNDKAPLRPMLRLLAPSGLVMKFPEGIFEGIDGFKIWRRNVRNKFLDQTHTIRHFDVQPEGDEARVSVGVHWEASTWKAPQPRSERIRADAKQTWTVVRSAESGRPVIQTYSVDSFSPAESPRPSGMP